MTEMFTTTGRPMTGQLQAALDNVGARDRALMAAALMEQQGRLSPLLRAVALELQLAGLREHEALKAAEADLAGPASEERPYPPSPTPGLELWFDPATGTFSRTPPCGPDSSG